MRSPKWMKASGFQAALLVGVLFAILPSALAGSWAEHTAKLSQMSKQIETQEHDIKTLIEHKRHANDTKQLQGIIKEIADKHAALKTLTEDYAKERQHVRFQHPEKNETVERVYTRHEFKTVEDLEREMGLDGRLDRLKARVLATFPIPEKEVKPERKVGPFRLPASKPVDEDAPDQVHLKK